VGIKPFEAEDYSRSSIQLQLCFMWDQTATPLCCKKPASRCK